VTQKVNKLYNFQAFKNANFSSKNIDKNAEICGNCKHFPACAELYYVSPTTKKCQFKPTKFHSKWAA
jgi:hypothetical protein